jgi:drug/metabolite transporter (DMT)-like permease
MRLRGQQKLIESLSDKQAIQIDIIPATNSPYFTQSAKYCPSFPIHPYLLSQRIICGSDVQNRNLLGIAFLCAGVLVYSLQDAIIKKISGEYAVTEALFLRSLVAVPLLIGMVHYEVGLSALNSSQMQWLTLRSIVLFLSYTTYYIAFPALPLAEAVTLYFTVPLFITSLAGPFLGEKVSGTSWLAVVVGFAGVVVVLQPGTSLFEPAALFSLLSAFFYASCALLARRLGVTESASVMAFYQNFIFLVGALLVAFLWRLVDTHDPEHPSLAFLTRPWIWPPPRDFLLMAACGAIAAVGATLLTHAYRIGEANRVGLFEFTGIFWIPLWGLLFFSEVPRWTTIAGAALVIGAGIMAFKTKTPAVS